MGPEQGLAQRKFLANGLSVSRVPILLILLLFTYCCQNYIVSVKCTYLLLSSFLKERNMVVQMLEEDILLTFKEAMS